MTEPIPPNLRIAMCETVADFHVCEDLQLAVWEGSEREIVPYDILRAIVHAGGTVIGAWSGEQMVGMALSFVAWGAAGAYHHSHLLGVLSAYRRWGVGWRLKMAQRDFVLAQGLTLMTWTFDPLESANAHLNFAKLGGISRAYLPDFYGAMPEALNAGMPSDRLLVEWHLDTPHVLGRLATAESSATFGPLVSAESLDTPYLLRMADDGSPLTLPSRGREEAERLERYRIEIPASIQAIKAADPARALAWRLATRDAFTDALARGYLATNYRAPRFHRPECGCYLLSQPVPDQE
ncbi:MAG: GNAT family N-acetyltransferase [Chloroflexota bacterium]|nr:GNAT family N-acetyltransferase [Chloroflexota bacterium]